MWIIYIYFSKIKRIYNREAEVIYPPVDTEKFEIGKNRENYYLTASRLVPYKRIDLVVKAFNEMRDKKLVVIGSGPEKKKIKNLAADNTKLIDHQPPEILKQYMQKSKAFVFAAEEDFGIIAVEAMACGTPVIALNKGGTSESVIGGKTGIHFSSQTIELIKDAVRNFEETSQSFNPQIIREHAEQFSRKNYEYNMKTFVDEKVKEFFKE